MESIMNMIGMKRPREEYSDSITSMANCLMLLSGAGGNQLQLLNINAANNNHHHRDVSPSRVFECKTCSRQFPSFQALGGHRASHKKPKLIGGDLGLQAEASPAKPKTHECSICGQEFAIGQALGGHMRRHRAAVNESPAAAPVIMEKSNSEKRMWGLDLNLAPLVSPPVLGCVS